jgi:tetratricopeptide (TPR) repeat protein
VTALTALLFGCGNHAEGPPADLNGHILRIPAPPTFDGFDVTLARACRQAADAVRARPDDSLAWFRLGMTYEAHVMHDYAEPCYVQAVVLDDGQPKPWYRLAAARERTGDVDGALEAFDRTLALAPDYGPAHRRRARFLVDLGRAEEARVGFQAALAINPDDVSAELGLVQVQLELGRPETALSMLATLEGTSRGSRAFARRLRALALTRMGRADEVGEGLSRGARPGGSDPWMREVTDYKVGGSAVLMRADRMLKGGKVSAAIALLEQHREIEPLNSRIHRRLGRAYGMAARWSDSAASMRTAAGLEPDDGGLWQAVAAALRESGNREGSLEALEKAIELDRNFAEAYLTRAELQLELGRFAAALKTCDLAAENNVNLGTIDVAAGKALVELGRFEESLVRFQHALALEVDLADAWAGCALAQLELGQGGAAAESVQRLEKVEPDHVLLSALRARLSSGEGDQE